MQFILFHLPPNIGSGTVYVREMDRWFAAPGTVLMTAKVNCALLLAD
jgi:hypothetical protein